MDPFGFKGKKLMIQWIQFRLDRFKLMIQWIQFGFEGSHFPRNEEWSWIWWMMPEGFWIFESKASYHGVGVHWKKQNCLRPQISTLA